MVDLASGNDDNARAYRAVARFGGGNKTEQMGAIWGSRSRSRSSSAVASCPVTLVLKGREARRQMAKCNIEWRKTALRLSCERALPLRSAERRCSGDLELPETLLADPQALRRWLYWPMVQSLSLTFVDPVSSVAAVSWISLLLRVSGTFAAGSALRAFF